MLKKLPKRVTNICQNEIRLRVVSTKVPSLAISRYKDKNTPFCTGILSKR